MANDFLGIKMTEKKLNWTIKDRIVYVVNHSFPHSSNGYAVRTHEVAKGIEDSGCSVVVVTRPGYPFDITENSENLLDVSHEIDGIRYFHIPSPQKSKMDHRLWLEKSISSYREFFQVFKPTLVVSASNWELAQPAQMAAEQLGLPFAYEVRGFWEISRASIDLEFAHTKEYSHLVAQETAVASKADRVFTLNNFMHQELTHRGIDKNKIQLMPNGFKVKTELEIETRETSNRKPTIGYVGSFARYEGLEKLVHIISELKKQGQAVNLLLVGSSNPLGKKGADCEVTKELYQLALKLDVEEYVNLVGRVEPSDLDQYFNEIDLIVIPRKKLPVSDLVSPIKPLEAAARRKAMLLSDIAPFDEFVDAGVAEKIISNDIYSVALQITQLLSDKDKLNVLGKKAYDWVYKNRQPEHIVKTLVEYLKELPSGFKKNSANSHIKTINNPTNITDLTFGLIDITTNNKHIEITCKPDQIINLSGKVLTQDGEKKSASLIQIQFVAHNSSKEEAKRLGLSFSEKLGCFVYIPTHNKGENDWSISFSSLNISTKIQITFRTWYPIANISVSLDKIQCNLSFENFILNVISQNESTNLPSTVFDEIVDSYSSETIAKNLRKVFDLGHISLANELLLLIKPADKIKYKNNVNTILGYLDFAKRAPTIPPRRKRKLPQSNTVCMVAHTALPFHSNGYATRTHEIAKQISKRYNLNVITRPGYPSDVTKIKNEQDHIEIDGVSYKNINGADYYENSLSDYVENASRALIKEFHQIKPKVVHASSSIHNALPALIASRKLGLPFIYEVRGFWEVTRASVNPGWGDSERYKIEHDLEILMAREADQVVALTGGIKKELVANGIDSNKITIVSNAISIDKFTLIDKPNNPNRVITIGYVGSVVEYEGLDDLIDALEIVADRGYEFKFVLAGDGNKLDEIKQKSAESKISDRIDILGRIPHDEVGSLLETIDIMPLPRKPLPVCEMVSPLKPFESMICKKALIGSNVEAIAEIINDGETGLLFEKGNTVDLADKICQLLKNPTLINEIGERAYKWVTEHKTWEKVSQSYESVYKKAETLHEQKHDVQISPTKVLVYGDVDMNYIDGSSIWAASITDVISSVPNVDVDILLKSDAYKSKVIKQISSINKSVRFISPSKFNCKQRFVNDDAVKHIQQLHQDQNYDIILIRGQVIYTSLAKIPEMDGLLWIYPIELLKKEEADISKSDLIPLRKARKLLCQSYAFQDKLIELGFLKDDIVFVPPMVPDSNKIEYSKKVKNLNKTIVYAGKFDAQWVVVEMFETFQKLYQADNQFQLHVYGEKIHNPSRCDKFEASIKDFLTMPGVVWHKGVEREVVLKELPLYDLAWAWRRPELDMETNEISTKFLEYSSSTLPIVCLNGSMNRSILGDDYPLFISNAESLVDDIRVFFDKPNIMHEAENRCFEAVKPFFFSTVAKENFGPAIDKIRPSKLETILVAGHDLKFINSHIRKFKEKGFKVLTDKWNGHQGHNEMQSYSKLTDSDVVICEWALGNSVWYTNRKLEEQKFMVRLHLQEESTDYPKNIALENIDFFNFINHQVERNVSEKFFNAEKVGDFFPNYIHFDEFSLPKITESKYTIGFIGIVPQRKRFDLALDFLESVRTIDKRYTLRVKGKLPEDFPWMKNRPEELSYYEEQYKRIEESALLKDAVIFDGHGNDMDHWFTTVGYIVSTSDFEGSHQAVAEGMASGCVPLILPWEGADELYPKRYVFNSINGMVDKVINEPITVTETCEIQKFVKSWDINLLNSKLIERLKLN